MNDDNNDMIQQENVQKEVLISIKGLSGVDEDGEDIEFVTGGSYSFDERRAALEYMESELTGMSGTKINMQMMFEEGCKHYVNYSTPFGSMTMGLVTQSIKNELTRQGGRLVLRYLMDLDTILPTRNKVEIEIKS